MKKSAIKIKAIILVLLSFVGIVNACIWIWITRKTKNKAQNILAWVDLVSVIAVVVVAGSNTNNIINSVILLVTLLPVAGVCLEIREYTRCQTLDQSVREFEIHVNELTDDMYKEVHVPTDSKLIKTSKRLYEEKGEVVLRAVAFKESEKKHAMQQAKEEQERRKQEEKRLEKQRKLEAQKAQAEAEAARAEAEKARAEIEKIELEKIRAKAEAANAEATILATERARAEAERAKAEAERARAEAERAKQDNAQHQEKTTEKTAAPVSKQPQQKTNVSKVDINRCSESELSRVPGVGIIAAKKAISVRDTKGRFTSVDEFIETAGIREANIEMVRERITCSAVKSQSAPEIKRGRKLDI